MKYGLSEFNQIGRQEAVKILSTCCGSVTWSEQLADRRPFASENDLFDAAREIWFERCTGVDYLEAFSHHPMIGDKEVLRQKYNSGGTLEAGEQAGVRAATEDVLDDLARYNKEYQEQNGYIFLVCATGKTAMEMLRLLTERLQHSRTTELRLAAGEQFKITLLRLQKLLKLNSAIWTQNSHITTHVLDTSVGRPGGGMAIRLKERIGNSPELIAMGITNEDGRIADLLAPGIRLQPGQYQMCFDTATYYASTGVRGFYPRVEIDFEVFDDSHYHVPLLINPFGYSTYRGS